MTKLVLSDVQPSGYNDPLTEDEVETIISLKQDEHLSVPEIAERMGRSDVTVRRYLTKNGIGSRSVCSKKPPMTPQQFKRARVLRARGLMSPEVSKAVGAPLEEVNKAWGAPSYDFYCYHR